ncbi:MAG: ornithine cyclodeaminase family protein [Chloroflexi bacterium]|nr:ornithine cyclodeaminase family protein [Chloroflexota bacterium]
MRILTAEEVRQALPMPAAIAAVREAYRAISTDAVAAPIRGALPVPRGVLLSMPAHATGSPISSVKLVNFYGDNPARGLPAIHGVVVVFDSDTGRPQALLEASSVTAIRTGAASGVASAHLAREDARVLALLGAGAQAPTQAAAVCAVRPIEEIRIFSLAGAESLATELRAAMGDSLTITIAESAAAAIATADIICTVTTSTQALFTLEELAPGAHINGIGAFTPEMQEIGIDVVTAAQVYVDHRESIWEEAGDLIIARASGQFAESDIRAEIGEVIAGVTPGRQSADELTFFKSVGHAAQDALAAAAIVARAEAENLGQVVDL